jgi:Tfp pilus assembly protein PilV
MTRSTSTSGHTLVEVIVALLVLEVGLLGATGMLVLASASMRRAGLIEEGAAQAAEVADSLERIEQRGSGSVERGVWRITWEPAGPMTRVRAELESGGAAPVELRLP